MAVISVTGGVSYWLASRRRRLRMATIPASTIAAEPPVVV
jgi:hypothetical protein